MSRTASDLSFAALRDAGFRVYFIASALAMMADSIEHVISYWILFEKFQSPALGGFAIISHWLPFLLFSMWSGALADRFDPRRIIQAGMVLFMGVSVAWGVLFMLDILQMWHAVVLLIAHGFAGVLWAPASQLLVHDIVGRDQLHSAVRLLATARYLGLLGGPAVGSALMLTVGSVNGILLNTMIYLPLLLWLWTAPYGPRFRGKDAAPALPLRGLKDLISTLRAVASNRTLFTMTLLVGSAGLFVGNGYQPQLPEFAHDLGQGSAGLTYGLLLERQCRRRVCGGRRAGGRRALAAAAQARARSGDAVVLHHRGILCDGQQCAGARTAVRRRLSRTLIRRHGPGVDSATRPGGDPGPGDRRIQYGRAGYANILRHHHWRDRRADRDSLVPGSERAHALRSGRRIVWLPQALRGYQPFLIRKPPASVNASIEAQAGHDQMIEALYCVV